MPDQIQRPATGSFPAISISRRRWLTQLATGSTAMCLAGKRHQSAAALPTERLRLAAIGVGNRGADNLTEIGDESVVALCDVDERYLDEAHRRFPDARAYRDFRELLERESLDAVVISTPDHTHFEPCRLAMERRLHVYCEKPLARSVAETRELAKLAAQHRVVTQMGNQHHTSRGYRRVAEIVQSGCLGALREVHAWTNRPLWPQSLARPSERPPVPEYLHWKLWLGSAPERPYHPTYHPFGWRGWWDFGGGSLADMGPHLLDPVVSALQLAAPQQISAECDGGTSESAPRSSRVQFEFAQRDNRPAVKLTWYDGEFRPDGEITRVKRLPSNGVLMIGEHGRLFIPELGEPPVVRPTAGRTVDVPPSQLEPLPSHMQQWLSACRSGEPPASHFTASAPLTELCLLGNLAIRCGRPLTWDAEKMTTGDEQADRWLSQP